MKAILVDAKKKELRYVDVPKAACLESLYREIQCDCVTTINLTRDDRTGKQEVMYLDDEGLLKDDLEHGFVLMGYPQVLAGNAVILGSDDEGNSVDTDLTIEEINDKIRFRPVTPDIRDEILSNSGKLYSLTDEQLEEYFNGTLDLNTLEESK